MKRILLTLFVVATLLSVTTENADASRKVRRWFGAHYGPGIHAYNGCPNCGCRHHRAAQRTPATRHANAAANSVR